MTPDMTINLATLGAGRAAACVATGPANVAWVMVAVTAPEWKSRNPAVIFSMAAVNSEFARPPRTREVVGTFSVAVHRCGSAHHPIGINAMANRRAKIPTARDAKASALVVGMGMIVLGKNGSLGRFKRPAPCQREVTFTDLIRGKSARL